MLNSVVVAIIAAITTTATATHHIFQHVFFIQLLKVKVALWDALMQSRLFCFSTSAFYDCTFFFPL